MVLEVYEEVGERSEQDGKKEGMRTLWRVSHL